MPRHGDGSAYSSRSNGGGLLLRRLNVNPQAAQAWGVLRLCDGSLCLSAQLFPVWFVCVSCACWHASRSVLLSEAQPCAMIGHSAAPVSQPHWAICEHGMAPARAPLQPYIAGFVFDDVTPS